MTAKTFSGEAPRFNIRHAVLAALGGVAFIAWLVAIGFIIDEDHADRRKTVERCNEKPTHERERCMRDDLPFPS
jgi:hypothetical protein